MDCFCKGWELNGSLYGKITVWIPCAWSYPMWTLCLSIYKNRFLRQWWRLSIQMNLESLADMWTESWADGMVSYDLWCVLGVWAVLYVWVTLLTSPITYRFFLFLKVKFFLVVPSKLSQENRVLSVSDNSCTGQSVPSVVVKALPAFVTCGTGMGIYH